MQEHNREIQRDMASVYKHRENVSDSGAVCDFGDHPENIISSE